MWYDDESHSIKVYGTKYHTLKAIQKVHERLRIIKNFAIEAAEDDEPKTKKQKTI